MKDDDMSVLYHHNKANVVADALSHMTMSTLSYVEEDMNDRVKDYHRLTRLSVSLEDALNGGFMVHHNSESSLVVEVKFEQNLDQPLMELKELVFYKLY